MFLQRFCRISVPGPQVAIALALALLFILSAAPRAHALPNFGVTPVEPPKKAPDFKLKDLAGKEHRLEDFRGKVIILNFWATWCAPCVEEIPSLVKLAKRFEDKDLVVVGIALQSPEKEIRKMLSRFNVTFPSPIDAKGDVAVSYGARALPTTYYINRKGEIVGILRGGRNWDSPASVEWAEHLLKIGQSAQSTPTKTSVSKTMKNDLQMRITSPSSPVAIDKAFLVQVAIEHATGPQAFSFYPPEPPTPKGMEFITMGSRLHSASQRNPKKSTQVHEFDFYYVPNHTLKNSRVKIGPFEAFYETANSQGSITGRPVTVSVGGETKWTSSL